MKIAIMQPYLFPYIGYWQLINAVDIFVIYDDVNYIQRGYINRNNILVNGKKYTFTLELIGASQNKKINEINVGNNQYKLLRTIEFSYKKAPYFNYVFPLIKDIMMYQEKNLALYIGNSIQQIVKFLDIKVQIIYSSHVEKNNKLKGQDKIIDICQILGAQTYINPIGGKDLYSKEVFKSKLIELYFLKPEILEYKQFNNEFIPNLSIIDVLMFNNKDTVRDMLHRYELL